MKNIFKMCVIAITINITGCNSGALLNNSPVAYATKVQNGEISKIPNINAIVPAIYDTKSGGLCSSTLLTPEYILTAAHCVVNMKEKPYGRVYESNDVSSIENVKVLYASNPSIGPVNLINNQTSYKVANVKKITIHYDTFKGAETYKDGGLRIIDETEINDLAVIQLESPIKLPNNYKYPQLANQKYKQYSSLITAGYGLNSGKGVINPDSYQGQSGILRLANTNLNSYRGQNKLIDVIKYDNQAYYKTCQGDSGGPDFIENNSGLFIVGVHSFGSGRNCGTFYLPGTSMSVHAYESWIKQQIKSTVNENSFKVSMNVCSSLDDKTCNKKLADISINGSAIIKLLMYSANNQVIKKFSLKDVSSKAEEGWQMLSFGENCIAIDLNSNNICLVTMGYKPNISSKESGNLIINYTFENDNGDIVSNKYNFYYSRK